MLGDSPLSLILRKLELWVLLQFLKVFLVLEGLVHLLTRLKGFSLVMPSVPPIRSVDPSTVPTCILGTPQTPSPISISARTSEHSILRLGVQPSSMLPP